MHQYTILLPTDNITDRKVKQLIEGITDLFGGLTVVNGVYGLWKNLNPKSFSFNKTIRDNHTMLIINTDKEAWIRTLKAKLEIELNEDWVYITKHKVDVIK